MYLCTLCFVFIRACRLKKKAQHEANKLKLYGLELEHKQLMKVLQRIRDELKIKVGKDKDSENEQDDGEDISMSSLLEDLIKENLSKLSIMNIHDLSFITFWAQRPSVDSEYCPPKFKFLHLVCNI